MSESGNFRTYEIDLAGRKLSVEIGRVAELAGGAAIVRYGDTVLVVTATASEKPRPGIDFFPLSVDYEEKLYAAGKIPGGFIKREGRPTEKMVLTSRLIDRPIRPLFPKNYRNDVYVVATVMSIDQDCDPVVAAMIGSSIALSISPIPFKRSTAAVSVGLVDGELVLCPDAKQREATKMTLVVASSSEKVMMIEAGAQEVDDETMLKGIELAHEENTRIVKWIEGIVAIEGKPKKPYIEHIVPEDIKAKIYAQVTAAMMEEAVFTDEKQIRDEKMTEYRDKLIAEIVPQYEAEKAAEVTELIGEGLYNYEKATVRRMILRERKRPDGRKLDEIRPLMAEVDILPRTHGSALFKRGQTQVLTITTLGSIGESQRLDGLDEQETGKRYMHQYNFPSYSVGETRPSRGPGRREIGHGALAERALLPVLPTEEEFPYAIRLVSEVLSSNGSTSQGSVCGSTLSLMAAGVPIKKPVAGISVGLVTGETDDDFVLLTDIQGIEDFFGDMDFKVAGTKDGITAIQMDMKIEGLTPEIIRGAILQTHEDRLKILDGVMFEAIAAPRAEISQHAPKIAMVIVAVDKIAEVIGSRGKVIHRIIADSGVTTIDTEDDGRIFIVGKTTESVNKAADMIRAIAFDPEVGGIYMGTVTRILPIGCMVEIAPEKEGLVHIRELAKERVPTVESVVKVGDMFNVKLLKVDERGRLDFSRKACL